jgi:hypothetical protein
MAERKSALAQDIILGVQHNSPTNHPQITQQK